MSKRQAARPSRSQNPFDHGPQKLRSNSKPKDHERAHRANSSGSALANLLLVALSFVSGVFSIKIYEKWEEKKEVKRVLSETVAQNAWMRVKAFQAPIYKAPHNKASPVGMYFKNYRLEIAGKSQDWVKIGPDRYMHLSDLEGIETAKF